MRLTQAAFGELGGSGKTTVLAWERGAATPNAAFLQAAARAGADVLYIVTGVRSEGASQFLAEVEDRVSREQLPISESRLREDSELRELRDRVRALLENSDFTEGSATSAPPETVRRARLLLRLAFDDAEEKVKAEQQLRAAGQRISEVSAAYEGACKAIGWRAPDSIAEALMGALFHRELTAGGCQSILGAIHREALDAGVWGAAPPAPPDRPDPAPSTPSKTAPPRGGRRPA